MITVSSGIAFTAALVYAIITYLNSFIAHSFLNRPIVVCPVLGLALGDVQMGLKLGADLELLFMGITTIGGSLPSDVFLASILVGTFCIGAGVPMETATTLAVAIGLVSAMFEIMVRILVAGAYVPFFDRWADEGNAKAYERFAIIGQLILRLPSILLVYLAVFLGADAVSTAMTAIPAFIQGGISVASGMMPAIGLGLLMNMLWSTKASIYFFFGFAIMKYLSPVAGISMTFVVIIAAFITLLQIYTDLDIKAMLKGAAGGGGANLEEGKEDDFFE